MTRLSAAIIAVFGPESAAVATLRAVREQTPGGVPVFAYAGNRAGLHALRALSGEAELVEQAGALALHEALSRCPEGQVLLTHDDVRLGPEMVTRMLRAARPGRMVVPHVNAPGTGHHLALQSERDLPGALRREAARRPATSSLHRIAPMIALADRDVLLEDGVLRHVAAPGAVLGTLALDFHAAKGAVAAHAGDCRLREVPAEELEGRPLLVATLIVRDEQHMLPDCLASLRGVVDEIVVCDTGSVDRTVEIAEAAGARVMHREWRDDFAWARNEAIEAAGNPWYVIVIDADERLVCPNPENLRRALAQSIDEHQSFEIDIRDEGLSASGQMKSTYRGTRIFRSDQVRYVGALHEQPTVMAGGPRLLRAAMSGLHVLHVGYDAAIMSTKDKTERNLAIAKAAWERSPGIYETMHYARALHGARREPELQVELLTQLVDKGVDGAVGAYILGLLAEHALNAGDAAKAMEHAAKALELCPADDVAALHYAMAAQRLGHTEAIADTARRRRAQPSPEPSMCLVPVTREVLAREGAARAETGDLQGAIKDASRALEFGPLHPALWQSLAAAITRHEGDHGELLGPLVALEGGDAMTVLSRLVAPEVTAEFAARTVEAQTATAAAVEIGLTAAILRERADLFERLLPGLHLVAPETLRHIAGRAAERGRIDFAERLLATLPAAFVSRTPLGERITPTVLFIEDEDGDPRVTAAVARCAGAVAEAGWTPVRQALPSEAAYGPALLPDGRLLPQAEARGLVEALRPDVIVFGSMARFQREAGCVLFHPAARVLLLVPASPYGPGDLIDAVAHPEDPGVEKTLLDLLETPTPDSPPEIPPVVPAETVPGLTSVLIAAGEQPDLLEISLRSLHTPSATPIEILVVGESRPAYDGEPEVRWIPGDGSVTARLNAGVAAARGEFVALLEPGYAAGEGWLEALLAALAVPGTGAAGPRFDRLAGLQNWGREPLGELEQDARAAQIAAWVSAVGGRSWPTARLAPACVLTRRSAFERLGGLDEAFGDAVVAVEDFAERVAADGAGLRIADGAVVVRTAPDPVLSAQGLGWVTRGAARHLAAQGRRDRVPSCALVLSDGQTVAARTTTQQALLLADRVYVLERGSLEATELAVLGISPGAVHVHALDWQADEGLPELLGSLRCANVLVLGAGEQLYMDSYEDVRSELETLPAGPVRVPVGELGSEVRIHPPTPDAVAHIGGSEGPVVTTFGITPAN